MESLPSSSLRSQGECMALSETFERLTQDSMAAHARASLTSHYLFIEFRTLNDERLTHLLMTHSLPSHVHCITSATW
jgi:hypothetical protein